MDLVYFILAIISMLVFSAIFSVIGNKQKEEDSDDDDIEFVFSVEFFDNQYFVYDETKHKKFVTQQNTIEDVILHITSKICKEATLISEDEMIIQQLIAYTKK